MFSNFPSLSLSFALFFLFKSFRSSNAYIASELGFLNLSKSSHGSPGNSGEDKDGQLGLGPLNFKPKDSSTPNFQQKNTISSPAIFFSSSLGVPKANVYNSSHSKAEFQETPGVFLNIGRNLFESPFPSVKDYFQTQEYIDTYADEPLSLIWSNDLFKDINPKIHGSPDILSSRIKKEESNGEFSRGLDQDDMFSVNFSNFANSRDYSKDFSRAFSLKKEEPEATCESDLSMQLERNFDTRPNPLSQSTIFNKKNSWEHQRSNFRAISLLHTFTTIFITSKPVTLRFYIGLAFGCQICSYLTLFF